MQEIADDYIDAWKAGHVRALPRLSVCRPVSRRCSLVTVRALPQVGLSAATGWRLLPRVRLSPAAAQVAMIRSSKWSWLKLRKVSISMAVPALQGACSSSADAPHLAMSGNTCRCGWPRDFALLADGLRVPTVSPRSEDHPVSPAGARCGVAPTRSKCSFLKPLLRGVVPFHQRRSPPSSRPRRAASRGGSASWSSSQSSWECCV